MPPGVQILESLELISSKYMVIAIGWHLLIYLLLLILVISKTKPGRGWVAIFISLPVFSVALVSAFAESYFNSIVFFLLTALILFFTLKSHQTIIPARRSNPIGIIIAACGLLYPHFTEDIRWIFFTAPVGLIPCPSLLLSTGLLIYFGSTSKAISITFIIAGLFYGLFGVFRLNVLIDLLLIAAVLPLSWQLFQFKQNIFLRHE
jgi:hypothetical protein